MPCPLFRLRASAPTDWLIFFIPTLYARCRHFASKYSCTFAVLSFLEPSVQLFSAKDFRSAGNNGFWEIKEVHAIWHPGRWCEKTLCSDVVDSPTKGLALRFIASIVDFSPVLREQLFKTNPELFSDAFRVGEINHLI